MPRGLTGPPFSPVRPSGPVVPVLAALIRGKHCDVAWSNQQRFFAPPLYFFENAGCCSVLCAWRRAWRWCS